MPTFADGICNDLPLGSQQSLEAGLAAKSGAEIVHSCVSRSQFVTRVRMK